MATAAPVTRTMDDFLDFTKTYTNSKGESFQWGNDQAINDLLTKIKDKGDVTSADLTQMIALTGQANIQSQFVSSLIQEYTSLMKALLQKMS